MTAPTREQVVEWMNLSGAGPATYWQPTYGGWVEVAEKLTALAYAAGQAAEREECAKVCEGEATDPHNFRAAIVARRCAAAIRARSPQS